LHNPPANRKQGPLTLLSQRKPREKQFLHYKIIGAPKKCKNWPRPLFRPRTYYACSQRPNPSRETVPLMEITYVVTRLPAFFLPVQEDSVEAPVERVPGGHDRRRADPLPAPALTDIRPAQGRLDGPRLAGEAE
jgi:hypothetical protein